MVESVEGVWVVAVLDGTRAVIGKVRGVKALTDETRNQIVSSKSALALDKAFDFFSPLQQLPPTSQEEMQRGQPRIGRVPIVMGFEFTSGNCPTYVQWSMLYIIDEMSKEDQETYKTFILGAMRQETEQRAARAGVVLADRVPAPPANGNGSSIFMGR
jgi:hypothetical protein